MAKYIDADALMKWVREFYPTEKWFQSAIINASPPMLQRWCMGFGLKQENKTKMAITDSIAQCVDILTCIQNQ